MKETNKSIIQDSARLRASTGLIAFKEVDNAATATNATRHRNTADLGIAMRRMLRNSEYAKKPENTYHRMAGKTPAYWG